MRKPVYSICEQQKRSLISTFVVRCLDSIISAVSISEISSLYLASMAAQAGLSFTWSKTLKTGFLLTRLKCTCICIMLLDSSEGLKVCNNDNKKKIVILDI